MAAHGELALEVIFFRLRHESDQSVRSEALGAGLATSVAGLLTLGSSAR